MKKITNPIITGFNPDPSIIRAGDDYFIATSTFEWFPGVQIFYSKDLTNWELACRPLDRVFQLDMRGIPSSGGIWAPCLTYNNGTYYLVYTIVKTKDGIWKDLDNYLVTTDDIYGEWSDPVYLNSSGIDPSLFHDEDGQKYIINMIWEHRVEIPKKSGGIILQEYSSQEKSLTGQVINIFPGAIRMTEGPHLYKRNGYYYLIVAEGGTGYSHAVTVARADKLRGPYEVHPDNPILTSRDDPELELQKAGHADMVETQNGEWYMVHLAARPLGERGPCPLGRETCIQKITWKDDWPYLANGGKHPAVKVPPPDLPEYPVSSSLEKDEFAEDKLNINYQTLRMPLKEDYYSLTARPGYLRLKGKESLSSKYKQSLLARRWKDFVFRAVILIDFEPETYQQMAGLVCLYDVSDFYYLRITYNEEKGKVINLLTCDKGDFAKPVADISIKEGREIYLKVKVEREDIQFYYSYNNDQWEKIGPVLSTGKLADAAGGFTGNFVGICCQDITGQRKVADFGFFEYKNTVEN